MTEERAPYNVIGPGSPDLKLIAEVPAGTEICTFKGMLVVLRPGMPPAIVTAHGLVTVQDLEQDDVGINTDGAFVVSDDEAPRH